MIPAAPARPVPGRDLSVEEFRETASAVESEVGKVIVGQRDLVRSVIVTLIAGGHALLEGVPGLGKTLLMRTLADVIDASFSRIQFTPDLMPADIVGTMVLYQEPDGGRAFRFEPGPVFANLVLADEINRATPKTQSALLESMGEHTVTSGKTTYKLPQPFFVLGTQNPLEMEGTFPLPEAQLDRFMFKLEVEFPSHEDLLEIALRTTGQGEPVPARVTQAGTVLAMQHLARSVPVAQEVLDYAARLVRATHPTLGGAPSAVREYVRYGASPRALQAIILGAKVHAILSGRHHASRSDVRSVAIPALRHRLILNFSAQAEGVASDEILGALIRDVPEA